MPRAQNTLRLLNTSHVKWTHRKKPPCLQPYVPLSTLRECWVTDKIAGDCRGQWRPNTQGNPSVCGKTRLQLQPTRLTLFLLLTLGRREHFQALTSGSSQMQTYLLTEVDGVAPAHPIPTVTRQAVAGDLEGEQRVKLGPSRGNTKGLPWREDMWCSTHCCLCE